MAFSSELLTKTMTIKLDGFDRLSSKTGGVAHTIDLERSTSWKLYYLRIYLMVFIKRDVAPTLQDTPLPIIYGYTPVELSESSTQELLSRFRDNSKLQKMIKEVIENPGVKSDELSSISGVSNIHQYRRMANAKLKIRGYEIKDFKAIGVAKNADFYQWYLVELKSTEPKLEIIEQSNASNDDSIH